MDAKESIRSNEEDNQRIIMSELYQSKDWLEGKYLGEQLSTIQIAKLCNCSKTTLVNQIKNFNIPIRSHSEAGHLRYKRKIGNDKYCDKDWLKRKYQREKLSTIKISELCGVSDRTILNWLYKFGIPIRNIGERIHLGKANHCKLSKKAIEWLNGELLGDGCLASRSIHSANFVYGSKYLEYIKYVSNILDSFGIKQIGKINKRYYEDSDYFVYHYFSLAYEELIELRKKWYSNRHKTVPHNIKLTPLTCRQWYIGDGSLSHQKGRMPHIRLATNGLFIEDTERLVIQLNKLGFLATRRNHGNRIGVSSYSTKDFLDYIGKCPVDCYRYKWDYEKWLNK